MDHLLVMIFHVAKAYNATVSLRLYLLRCRYWLFQFWLITKLREQADTANGSRTRKISNLRQAREQDILLRTNDVIELLRKTWRYYQIYGYRGLMFAAESRVLSQFRQTRMTPATAPSQASSSQTSSKEQFPVTHNGKAHARNKKDTVVLITGASRGIGYITAQAFLNNGAQVAVCAPNPTRLVNAESKLRHLGPVWAQPADLRQAKQVRAFVDGVLAHYGHIDVLVNNAGRAMSGQFVLESDAAINEMVDVNVKGLLYMTHAVLPAMLRQKNGVIINLASGAGRTGLSYLSVYSASKFAVVGFTQALGSELQNRGVRVHAVCPGAVATDMLEGLSGHRNGMPAERVAQAILQLAGPNPQIGTGECLELRHSVQ